MNKINRKDEIEIDSKVDQDEEPTVEENTDTSGPNAASDPLKTDSHDQVATRRDLIELHKRMVDMFKTLSTGLTALTTEKAEKDRATLSARIDEMERSLNTMEGMVRIEMVPQFRTVLNEALEERDIGSSSRLGQRIFMAALAVACVTAGVIWSADISAAWTAALDYGQNLLTQN